MLTASASSSSGQSLGGSGRILYVGLLVFIGIAAYVLVLTHHLKMPSVRATGKGFSFPLALSS